MDGGQAGRRGNSTNANFDADFDSDDEVEVGMGQLSGDR